MGFIQLRVAYFDCKKSTGTNRQWDWETEEQSNRDICSNGPHWGPLGPSVGENASGRGTPTLVIVIVILIIYSIKNIEYKYKTAKSLGVFGRTDRQMDILYFHSGDLTQWPASAYAAHNYRPHALIVKNNMENRIETQIEIQRDKETDRLTHNLDWTPLGSSGPQCHKMYCSAGPTHLTLI